MPFSTSACRPFNYLSGRKIKFAQMLVGLRQKEGEIKAGEAIKTGEGTRLMDQLKALTADFNHEEQRLLAIRLAETRRRVNQAKIFVVLGVLLALVTTSGAAWALKEESPPSHPRRARSDRERKPLARAARVSSRCHPCDLLARRDRTAQRTDRDAIRLRPCRAARRQRNPDPA